MLARVTTWLLLSIVMLSLVGMFLSNFAPSPATQYVALAGALAVAVYFFVAWFDPPNALVPKWDESAGQKNWLLRTPWLRGLFMASMGMMLSYAALSAGAPWIYTSAFGQPGEAYFIVTGWERFRGQCSRPRLDGMPLLLFSRRAFCFGDDLRGTLRPGMIIRVTGSRSALGIIPERLFVAPEKTLAIPTPDP